MCRYAVLQLDIQYDSFIRTTDAQHEVRIHVTKGSRCEPYKLGPHLSTMSRTFWSHAHPAVPSPPQALVAELLMRCNEAGDIYKADYSGYYCVDCEEYKVRRGVSLTRS
jgi:methionyl-tRNA synthetase